LKIAPEVGSFMLIMSDLCYPTPNLTIKVLYLNYYTRIAMKH